MPIESLSQLLWLIGPLGLLAWTAGALRAMGQRQAEPSRARLLQALWMVLLLCGAPLWILVAAALGLL